MDLRQDGKCAEQMGRTEEFMLDLWRRVQDGRYGNSDGLDLEALTDDFTEGMEEIKYQTDGDALAPEVSHEAAQGG